MNKGIEEKKRTREEWEDFLRKDFEEDTVGNGQELYRALQELSKDEPVNEEEIDFAWKDFQAFYAPKKKRNAVWRWAAAAAAIVVMFVGVLATNGQVQAAVKGWISELTILLGIHYEKNVSPYEKEMNVEIQDEGYTLHIYTMGQTSTSLVVEYALEDKNGAIIPVALEERSLLWEFEGSAGVKTSFLPPRENGKHQRVVIFYSGKEIDFTPRKGTAQRALFGVYSEEITEESRKKELDALEFELEFTMDDIYPKTVYRVEKDLQVENGHIYVEEIVDDGMFLSVKVQKTSPFTYAEKGIGNFWLVISDENGEIQGTGGNGLGSPDKDVTKDVWWNLLYQRRELPTGNLTLQAVLCKDLTGLDRKEYNVYSEKITVDISQD